MTRLSQGCDKVVATPQPCHHLVISVWESTPVRARKPLLKIDCRNSYIEMEERNKCVRITPLKPPPLPTHPKNIIYKDLCTVPNLRFSGSCTYRVQNLKALTFNNLQGNNLCEKSLTVKMHCTYPYKQDLASF